ncbi:MAG: radical SAM protein [Phycisphaerales bacterium]|nr:MAG: radical SAM protein [Phycisphaerales bacterium]
MKNQSNKPRLIAFEVTRRCRFNCRHCRAEASDEPDLTTSQCVRILESIADFCRPVIIMTGGEPTERRDICELLTRGRDLGLPMVMATCGYKIDEDFIAGLKAAGIIALSFSIDGASSKTHDAFRRTPGAFETALHAARIAAKANVRFQINTTITKRNLHEVPQIARLARNLGAYCFNPFILVPTGRGRQIAEDLLEPAQYEKLLEDLADLKQASDIELRVTCGPQFSRIWRQRTKNTHKLAPKKRIAACMGGREFGFVSYRGDVQTCGFLNVSAGNLVENGFDFADMWRRSPFLKEIRDVAGYHGDCAACRYSGICGGCRARAYAVTGDYLAKDPICDLKADL